MVAAEKRQFIDDQRHRNAIEGKIGQGKRQFSLGLLREKVPVTQDSTVAMNVLVMSLQKLLKLLFVLFAPWLVFCLAIAKRMSNSLVPLACKPLPSHQKPEAQAISRFCC